MVIVGRGPLDGYWDSSGCEKLWVLGESKIRFWYRVQAVMVYILIRDAARCYVNAATEGGKTAADSGCGMA